MRPSTAVYATIRDDARSLVVRRRSSLTELPETAVVLGDAPDGLPLVLEVRRHRSVQASVLSVLGVSAPEALEVPVADALTDLEGAVEAGARTAGVTWLGSTPVYRSTATIGALLGDTMMARILGAHSPLVLPEDRAASGPPQMEANTAVMALASGPVTLMKSVAAERYLAVPGTDGPVLVAEIGDGDDGNGLQPEAMQPLVFEDLRGFDSTSYVRDDDGDARPLAEQGYRSAVREAGRLGWAIDADDVGIALAQLGRELDTLHGEGRVHGDVKPGNTVITADGAVAIDPLGVAAGEPSPGATPGWAAPEQILARPVAPPTDVYALGLMAAQLIGATVYGEERSFVIPVGGGQRRRIRLLAAPDVFIDPSGLALPDDIRGAWAALVASCVAFEPEQRPPTGAAFADRLESLLASAPLSRRFHLQGGPGELRRDVDVLGDVQPAWVVTDTR